MADAMWMKIRDVNWKVFKTSAGDASSMPTILKNLSSRKEARAIRASHQLWTALCGGGGVHSAVVPAIPLLLEIFSISAPSVQDGIIDVLVRCDTSEIDESWSEELSFVIAQSKDVLSVSRIRDEIVAAKLVDFCN